MTNFRTRLPELKFEINEATVLSVLSEWIRDTYELAAREYNLDFVKSAIDGQYYVTATFIDASQRRPVSFSEIAEETKHDSNFQRPSPFTITAPSQDTNNGTDESVESGSADNSVHPPEV